VKLPPVLVGKCVILAAFIAFDGERLSILPMEHYVGWLSIQTKRHKLSAIEDKNTALDEDN
jgi:hypothetical protein